MFGDMRMLGLYFLANELGAPAGVDLEAWYRGVREKEAEKLFPYLVEASDDMAYGYVLSADKEDPDLARLSVEEMSKKNRGNYPFVKSAPAGPQVGPIFKKGLNKDKEITPKASTFRKTMDKFAFLGRAGEAWSPYFEDVLRVCHRTKLFFQGEEYPAKKDQSLLSLALEKIEQPRSFLVIRDSQGRLPGESKEFMDYLQSIGKEKYTTKIPSKKDGVCSICGCQGEVFANSLAGAGLNWVNMDRRGAFPSFSLRNAWKAYALCLGCSDVLYVYKNHILKLFRSDIAGEPALVIPHVVGEIENRKRLSERLEQYMKQIQVGDVHRSENNLLRFFADEETVGSLTIAWVKFGQLIEEPRGMLLDILPSRLGELSKKIGDVNESWKAPSIRMFPQEIPESYRFDLHQNVLKALFNRPGGKSANAKSDSERLGVLRRELLGALLYKRSLDERRFWQEWLLTAQEYLRAWGKQDKPDHWYFLSEPPPEAKMAEKRAAKKAKKGEQEQDTATPNKKPDHAWMTMGGWVRHIARYVHFLRSEGVFAMEESVYEPKAKGLKPYFGKESGINSNEKAFAFFVGCVVWEAVVGTRGASCECGGECADMAKTLGFAWSRSA